MVRPRFFERATPNQMWQTDIFTFRLPGAERLDIANSLAIIDQMAGRVRSETERHAYRFQKNPAEFENSEGFFRMTMMMVVHHAFSALWRWSWQSYKPGWRLAGLRCEHTGNGILTA
jgi:hypothetical protein